MQKFQALIKNVSCSHLVTHYQSMDQIVILVASLRAVHTHNYILHVNQKLWDNVYGSSYRD